MTHAWEMTQTQTPADWYTDPTGRHQLRYYDGAAWSDSVSDDGVLSQDPGNFDATSATDYRVVGQAPNAKKLAAALESLDPDESCPRQPGS